MIITSATLDALRTEFSLVFKTAYDSTPVWYLELATELTSKSKSNTYGWIAQQLRMKKWLGARTVTNLSEHSYQLGNSPFQETVELDKYDIEDDNLSVFASMTLPELAQAAKKHPDQLLTYGMFYTNPKAFDGKALFATDHPTFAKNASDPQTYSNSFTLPLTPDNFNTVWANAASFTGEDGQPLMVLPNRLIIPPQLKLKAEQITKSGTILQAIQNVAGSENVGAAGVDNMLKGWAEPLVLPELSLMPQTWYLACTTRPLKPFVRQLRTPYTFVSRVDPSDPKVFDQHVFTYGAEGRGTVGCTLPFLISRSMPAGDSLPTVPAEYLP
jgi:phage major head subunit gpT-like protein